MNSLEAKECGHVSAAHGVKGFLKVVLEKQIDLQKGTWCFLDFQKKPVPFFVEECSVTEDVVVLKLKGIDTPEQASALRGKAFLIEPIDGAFIEESEDTSYNGYEVSLPDGRIVGRVSNVYDNSGQLLLQVKASEEEFLIPFHEDWVENLDATTKSMVLNVPDGLLNI